MAAPEMRKGPGNLGRALAAERLTWHEVRRVVDVWVRRDIPRVHSDLPHCVEWPLGAVAAKRWA